jgi:hypothetical protein
VSAGRKCVCKNEKLSTIGTNHFVANGFNHWILDHPMKENVVDMTDNSPKVRVPEASNICSSKVIHLATDPSGVEPIPFS